jgi:hypothetical protein
MEGLHPFLQRISDNDQLTDKSKAVYIGQLKRLSVVTGRTLEQMVRKPNSTYRRITAQYDNPRSLRTMIVAIKSLFKHNPNLRCEYPEAWEKWHTKFQTIDAVVTDEVMRGEPTDKERQNWVRWADVVAKEQELARTEYASDDHLLLAMYTLIEPARQDYAMIALHATPPADQTKGNFLVLPRAGGATLVLNDYKTSKTYSTYTRVLPDNLTAIIRASVQNSPRQWLFTMRDGSPYTNKSSYVQYSNSILKRLFGRSFTVRMMRHSYISEGIDFARSSPGDLFEAAKHMHHSVAQQQLYRRKVEPENVDVVMRDSEPAASSSTSSYQISRYTDRDDASSALPSAKAAQKKKKKKSNVVAPPTPSSSSRASLARAPVARASVARASGVARRSSGVGRTAPVYKPQEFIDLMF